MFRAWSFWAQVLAAAEDAPIRNGNRAVELAQRVNALTGDREPFVLGSLAMAYAEAGKFEGARQIVERRALAMAGTNTDVITNLQAQLRFYESNQPYRENFAKSLHP